MKIAVGTDERTHVTDLVVEELKRRGHQVQFVGPLTDETYPWPEVAQAVGEKVAAGECDEGVLFCWTGTGVSIAANKVPGVRAALCSDAETARGARAWNQANVPPSAACGPPRRLSPGRSWTPGAACGGLTQRRPRTWPG